MIPVLDCCGRQATVGGKLHGRDRRARRAEIADGAPDSEVLQDDPAVTERKQGPLASREQEHLADTAPALLPLEPDPPFRVPDVQSALGGGQHAGRLRDDVPGGDPGVMPGQQDAISRRRLVRRAQRAEPDVSRLAFVLPRPPPAPSGRRLGSPPGWKPCIR